MVLNVVLSRVPTRANAAIAATAISAAISAYSTAVTPNRSCSNLWSTYMRATFGLVLDPNYSEYRILILPYRSFAAMPHSPDKRADFDRNHHLADRPQGEAGEL